MHKALFKLVFHQMLMIAGMIFWVLVSHQVSAQTLHLSLCIDASGSIGAADFAIETGGTADAIRDVVPIDGSVEISVVVFGTVGTPLTFTETDNGNAPTNSIVVDSASDIEDIATEVENTPYPAPQGTNTQDCINQAMVLLGCGAVEDTTPGLACPSDIVQVIDISTDGDPTLTSLSTTLCENDGFGDDLGECQNDAVAASNVARDRGVDVINVIGVGSGPTVVNMQEWAFDAITTPPPATRPAASTIEVFDPGNSQGGNGYTIADPVIGDRGYVVIVGDFDEYEPTINAKIFNELNIVSDISVVKTADQATVSSGGTLTYTLAVTNSDAVDVPNVVVTDTLPPGVTFVSADDNPSTANVSCSESSGTVTCDIPSLTGSSSIDIDVVVTVN